MIGCMKSCGWSKGEILQLILFYLSLDVHPIRVWSYSLEAVMQYQERIRRDWTVSLKSGTTYSIAKVNNELIKECREDISGEIQARYNVSLKFISQLGNMADNSFLRTIYVLITPPTLWSALLCPAWLFFTLPHSSLSCPTPLHMLCSAPSWHALPHTLYLSFSGGHPPLLTHRCWQLRPDKVNKFRGRRKPGKEEGPKRPEAPMTEAHQGVRGYSLAPPTKRRVTSVGAPHLLKSESLPFVPTLLGPQSEKSYQPDQYAWADTGTASHLAKQPRYGMAKRPSAPGQTPEGSSTNRELSSVPIGSALTDVPTRPESTSTNAQDMGQPIMEQTLAALQSPRIVTPLIASEWLHALQTTNLLYKYPHIPSFISHSADAGIPCINSTFTPPNHPSVTLQGEAFLEIVNNEFIKKRYWGLFSKAEIEKIIGLFQTSPLSLIPKPGKPSKFRLIQNLSFLLFTKDIPSINSSIVSNLYLCTWGTFATVATLIWSLPPGSLGACKDVSEAYRIIPLAQNQWPGVVVRLQSDEHKKPFVLNTCVCFGKKSSGGLFGMFGDALLDILCAAGVGLSLRWVDEFVFFSIQRKHLPKYNKLRNNWKK